MASDQARVAQLARLIPRAASGGSASVQYGDERSSNGLAGVSAGGSGSSIRDKIEKNRVEERRRLRNIGQLANSSDHGSLRSASSSASARVGAMFLESSAISAARNEARDRNSALKRQVAGPVPPSSWAGSFLNASTAGKAGSRGKGGRSSAAGTDLDREIRERMTACARLMFKPAAAAPDDDDEGAVLSAASTSNAASKARDLPSLADLCLVSMVSHSRRRKQLANGEELWQLLPVLPLHVKHRIMALCGRMCRSSPLRVEELCQLWPHTATEACRCGFEDSGGGGGDGQAASDDWDAEAPSSAAFESLHLDSMDDADLAPLAWQQSVDLSFCGPTVGDLTTLLLDETVGFLNVQLKILSLAGTVVDLLDERSIIQVLGACVNLQQLSLAGSQLLSNGAPVVATSADDADAAIWLSGLSRALPKLHTLDLSYCTWLTHTLVGTIAKRPLFASLRTLALDGTGYRAGDAALRHALAARRISLV